MSTSPSRDPVAGAVATSLVCLGFAAFTGHAWEDYFITFRASLNLASGHGLVFQPGERVHSFTSPLGTLLPALFALGGGDDVALRALWGLRVVSAAALGVALWIALRAFQREGLARGVIVAIGIAWVLDPKTVDFSMNGMETSLVVLFVILTWRAFVSGAQLWPCALGFAGLQWTRPDGCVYFLALAGAWLWFGAPASGLSWPTRLAVVTRAMVLGGAIYLPWFVFAWAYYGSPVPHTILAKAQPHAIGDTARMLALYPWRLLFGSVAFHDLFKPAYFFFGGWPDAIAWSSRLLVVGAALAWLWPRVAVAGRIASAAFFLGGFYITYIPAAPWYFPGWQALALVAWAHLLHALWSTRPRAAWATELPRAATRIGATLLVLLQAGLFVCVAWQMHTQQRLIENENRREIGRWLAHHARPGDNVFLECLGYIGYYSGLKMLDFPGLSSPEVLAARRAGHRSFAQIIATLQPDWLVLRPDDAAQIYGEIPTLRPGYELVRSFDNRRAVDAVPVLPGRGYLNFDAVFLIYRHTAPAGQAR